MFPTRETLKATEGRIVGVTMSAKPQGAAKLTVLHREAVPSMPRGEMQEVRVLYAKLEPGDRTPHHTHRFPVTVCVHEGTFTLQLEGRPPVAIRAGESFIEPAHVPMTGQNLDPGVATTMTLFYVSDPDTPFADPVG